MLDVKKIVNQVQPDFKELEAIFRGESSGNRVHFIELGIDDEIAERIYEDYLDGKWIPNNPENTEKYLKQKIEIYSKLGYDALLEGVWRETWKNHPNLGSPETEDTAGDLARDQRSWANEGIGIIDTWDDYNKFPWDKIYADLEPFKLIENNLPSGMKMFASSSFFEHVMENLLGYEGLFYKIIDNPDLVTAVFDSWGEKVLEFYKQVVSMDGVGAIWHADDLGFKTGPFLSPADMNRWVIPWMKKFAKVAHDHGKLFILHSCGNHFNNGLIDVLIDEVKVDVLHSFQDVILPVNKALEQYGNRIAMAGGVDVDVLCRAEEKDLRKYVSEMIDNCAGKRWALGTGNTVANYIPPEQYLIMLEEGMRSIK
jgi:uroporphyrinogen decarboxylase